jgi:hypothetical protein
VDLTPGEATIQASKGETDPLPVARPNLLSTLEFGTFSQYIDLLSRTAEFAGGDLNLATFLTVSACLTEIGHTGDVVAKQFRELESSALNLKLSTQFRGLLHRIESIHDVLVGNKPASGSLSELSQRLSGWMHDLPVFLNEMAEVEHRLQLELQFRRVIDQVHLLMQSTWFTTLAEGWQSTYRQLVSGQPDTVQMALQEFLSYWSGLREPLFGLATRYKVPCPHGIQDQVNSLEDLAQHLRLLVQWLDTVAPKLDLGTELEISGQLPARRPILDLMWKFELQLIKIGSRSRSSIDVLKGLCNLGAQIRPQSEENLPLSTEEQQSIVGLVNACSAGVDFPHALILGCQLLPAEEHRRLHQVISLPAQSVTWRLNGTEAWRGSAGAFVIAALRDTRSTEPTAIPIPNLLHAELRFSGFYPEDDAQLDDFGELLKLGAFGAWAFAAYLERGRRHLDRDLFQKPFFSADDGCLALQRVMPLVQMTAHVDDEWVKLLLAALELCYPEGVVNWRWVYEVHELLEKRAPHTWIRIQAVIAGARGNSEQVSASDLKEIAQARDSARNKAESEVGLGKYSSASAAARVISSFLHGVAAPLLDQAKAAANADQCTRVIQNVESKSRAIEARVTEEMPTHDAAHSPHVVSHCRDMLAAILYFAERQRSYFEAIGKLGGSEVHHKLRDLCGTGPYRGKVPTKISPEYCMLRN